MAQIGKELETITVSPEPLLVPFPIDVPEYEPVQAPVRERDRELVPA